MFQRVTGRSSKVKRAFALLAILSFTFTQAVPAYALRPEHGASPKTKAGLEEQLFQSDPQERSAPAGRGPAAALAVTRQLLQQLGPGASAWNPQVRPGEVPPQELIIAVWGGMQAFLPGRSDLAGKVEDALRLLQSFQQPGTRSGWDEEAVRSEIEEIARHSPQTCTTCAARGLVSLADSPYSGLPQSRQPIDFRRAEDITALLIALDVWLTGSVQKVEEPAGQHQVYANTLLSVQAVYQAAELAVPSGLRREWTGRFLTPSQLKEALKQGEVLAFLGGNHYARILGYSDRQVTYEMPARSADGVVTSRPVTEGWEQFYPKWKGDRGIGVALISVPEGQHVVPGRAIREQDARKVIGCCGVSNASGVDGMFARSAASQFIVRILESRGFDNFASARKHILDLPVGFDLEDGRHEALKARLAASEGSGAEDILLVPAMGDRPAQLRFFAISRGVGSATANLDTIAREITEQMSAVARLVYGRGVHVHQDAVSGHWRVMKGIYLAGTIKEVGAADHTRFKTKGDDIEANAHHLSWKGVSVGFNGDWNDYEPAKAILMADRGEPFFGNSDYEPLAHVIGNMSENKDLRGRVVGHAPSETTVIRAFRLIENMSALLRASDVLQPDFVGKAGEKGEEAQKNREALIRKLTELGLPVEELRRREQVGDPEQFGNLLVPVFVRKWFNAVMDNPALMDQEASAANGWKGYYRHLSRQLPQTYDEKFDNPGTLNISINVLSLHDDHSAVVARTYVESTDFYWGFGSDPRTDQVTQILGGSDARGFAPLIGEAKGDPVPIREGIVNMVNGKVSQLKAGPWSVYTVDQVQLDRHGVWDGALERVKQGNATDVKWTHVVPGMEKQNAEWTRFRLETWAQPITLGYTVQALTQTEESGARSVRLPEATDRPGEEARRVMAALSNPETVIYGGGSGSSLHALLLVQRKTTLFDEVRSSDEWLSRLPRNLIRKEVEAGRPPVFVVVSQSGTTGAAKKFILELINLGAIVIGVTNIPGTPVYDYTLDKGGVIVTQSIVEEAVAATGSNTSQAAALELLAMKREALVAASGAARQQVERGNADRLQQMISLTTRRDKGQVHKGTLVAVLESFEERGANALAIEGVVNWMKEATRSGLEESEVFSDKEAFRSPSVVVTGVGSVAQAVGPETALKVMEVTRKLSAFVPAQVLLAYGISAIDPRSRFTRWDWQAAAETLEANLKRYTSGGPDLVGRFPYFPNLLREDRRLTGAREILLLADGDSLVNLDQIASVYQTVSPIPVKRALYSDAPRRIRRGAVVIAVQPWTAEQRDLLNRYRSEGGSVIVLASPPSPQRSLEPQVREVAEREGGLLWLEGEDFEFASAAVLDLLLMRVLEALRVRTEAANYTNPTFLEKEVGRLREQVEGIRQEVASFNPAPPAGAVHRNAVALKRLKEHPKNRGWNHFDWWSTGKGTRFPVARDLALRIWAATGKVVEAAELSEFKHGRNGATNYGDIFFNVWPPNPGTKDWEDGRKTAIDEEVPRLANYPFPIFRDSEPGMIVLVAKEDDSDRYLVHLEDEEFEQLRSQRRRGGAAEVTKRPDIVFTTPHGGYLEHLAANRMIAEGLADSLSETLREQEKRWEEVVPPTLVINLDVGESFPGKQGIYQALRESFPRERSRILTISPVGEQLAEQFSDAGITITSQDPLAYLVVGHQLTTRLVEARFGRILQYLLDLSSGINEEIEKGREGALSRLAPQHRTPGSLVYAYAIGNPEATRALRDFAQARQERYGDLEQRLREIMDWYNVNPFKELKAAKSYAELMHSVVDLIDKLSKVVVNNSGIKVGGPARGALPLSRFTLGAADPGQIRLEPEAAARLAEEPEALEQMRRILADTLGEQAVEGLQTPAALAEAFLQMAGPRVVQAAAAVRGRYPDAPATLPITLHLFGDRLAHVADGEIFLNAHALWHPLLVEMQLEHELAHELIGPAAGALEVPTGLLSGGVSELEIRRAVEEVVAIRLEASRFFGYSPSQQHEVLEVLQGPNPVDPTGAFDALLQDLRKLAPGAWTGRILQFIRGSHPHLTGAAALAAAPLNQVDALVGSVAGGRVAISPEPVPPALPASLPGLPGPMVPIRAGLMDQLWQEHGRDRQVHFGFAPGPQSGQATLLAIGVKGQAGVAPALIMDLGKGRAEINISALGGYDLQKDEFSYVVVDATEAELTRPRPELGGRSVIEQIASRIDLLNRPDDKVAQALADLSNYLFEQGRRGRSPKEDINWFSSLYWHYLNHPDLYPALNESAELPDLTFVLVVFPYRRAMPEVAVAVPQAVNRYLVDRGLLPQDEVKARGVQQQFFTPFPQAPAPDQAGFLLLALPKETVTRLQAVEEAEGEEDAGKERKSLLGVVEEALQPYVRGAQPAAASRTVPVPPKEGPRGPVYGIAWGANAPEAVRDNTVRWAAQRGLGSIARSLVQTARGAVAMPEGGSSLDDLGSQRDPNSPRTNLDRVAEHVRTTHARRLLERGAQLVELTLARQLRQDRLGLVQLGNGSVAWIVAGESVKSLLTNNYGAPLRTGETGSGVAAVILDREAAVWVLPEELDMLYNEPYVIQLVTHLPAEVQERIGADGVQRLLNPLPSVAMRENGTTELERQLDELAQLNGIPADPQGRPDLGRVRISHLPRGRSRLLAEEFERLRRERGLQLNLQLDGSITSGLAALPPRDPKAGYTEEDPLEVSWTTTWATQGLHLLTSIGGGAFPEGPVGAIRFLPRSINDPSSVQAATPEHPIGGADAWEPEVRSAFAKWQPELGAQLVQGRPLYHTDISGRVTFLFIPTTDVGVDLHDPIPDRRGIPALEFREADGIAHYYGIVGQAGNLFVEEIETPVRTDIPVPPLLPPSRIQLDPAVEEVSFRLQAERWVAQWAQDHLADSSIEAARQLVDEATSLFQAFRAQGNAAQVGVVAHPSGREGEAVLLVLAPRRSDLSDSVRALVRRMGGRVGDPNSFRYRERAAFLLLEVDNLPVQAIPLIRDNLRSPPAVSPAELDLIAQLKNLGRNEQETDWLLEQYRAYHEAPRYETYTDPETGEFFIVGIAPYIGNRPSISTKDLAYTGDWPADLNAQLEKLITDKVPPQRRVAVTAFHHATEKMHPVVLVLISISALKHEDLLQMGILEVFGQGLDRLSGGEAAGLEEARDKAEARGWTEEMDRGRGTGFFVTQNDGRVAVATGVPGLDVDPDAIDATALIFPTAVVVGSETVIKTGAQVHGIVVDAEVHENVVQRGILRTVPALGEDWNPKLLGITVPFKPSKLVLKDVDPRLQDKDRADPTMVRKVVEDAEFHKAILGPGARVESNELEVINTHVSSVDDERFRTLLALPGIYQNVEIGYGNRHLGAGMIKVLLPARFEDLVTVYADKDVVQEFSEARIPMGRTYLGDAHNYIEFSGVNGYLWLERAADGSLQTRVAGDLPAPGIDIGGIYASFDGTFPLKLPEITEIPKSPSSGHWWIPAASGVSAIGATVVGLHHGEVEGSEDLLTRPDLTLPGGFVLLENTAHGIPLPGSRVTGPSATRNQDPLWSFSEQNRQAVWGLVHEAWVQARRVAGLRAVLDRQFDQETYLTRAASDLAQWPQRMLSTAALLAEVRRDKAGTDVGAREFYDAVVQGASQLLQEFSLDPTPAALDRLIEGPNPRTRGYEDAVALARSQWEKSPVSEKEALVRDAVSRNPLWRPQDLDFFDTPLASSQIDSGVVLDPEAMVVGPNRLTGNTRLGRGVIVIGSELHNFQHPGVSGEAFKRGERVFIINSRVDGGSAGEGTSLMGVIGDGIKLGKTTDGKSSYRFSRLERFTAGDNSSASGVRAYEFSVGSGAELKTGANLKETTAGKNVILGGIAWDSEIGDGFVQNHAGSAMFGAVVRNIPVYDAQGNLMGEVPNPTNHSDGAVLGHPQYGRNQVFLDGHVMFAAHTWVKTVTEQGLLVPVHLGGGSFVKGIIQPGMEVMPLEFFDGSASGAAPSLVLDRVGPDFMQFLIGYPLRKADLNVQAPRVAHLMPTLLRQALDVWPAQGVKRRYAPEQVTAVQDRLLDHLNSGRWNVTWNAAKKVMVLANPLVRTEKGYVFKTTPAAAQQPAGLEEQAQQKPAYLMSPAEKVELLLGQARSGLWKDFAAQGLAVGTDPALFRERLDAVLSRIAEEFEDVEKLEDLNAPRQEQMQNMTSFLFSAYQQLSSRVVQMKTLTNVGRYGTDALTVEQADAAAAKVLDLLRTVGNRFSPLARAVIDDEWQANLLRLALKDVEKPYDAATNPGDAIFAKWAREAAQAKDGQPPATATLDGYAQFLARKVNESNMQQVELVVDEVFGYDYGGITTRLAVLTGVNFVMMNPTLARRGVRESPQAFARVSRHVLEYAKAHEGATGPDLWAQGTFAAGWYSRMALYPEFLLSRGQRGQVSLQLDPRRYTKEEILADIDRFAVMLAEEGGRFLNNFVVDSRVLSAEEIQANFMRPDGSNLSTVNTVFKVDGSNVVSYGNILAEALKLLKRDGWMNLAELGRLQIADPNGSLVTALHARGISTNYTAHFRVGFAANLTQWAGNAVARKEGIPVHGGYKTQMAGRGDEFLAEAVLHFLINEDEKTGPIGVLPAVLNMLLAQDDESAAHGELIAQFERILADVKKLSQGNQGIIDQIRSMKVKLGDLELPLEEAINRLQPADQPKLALPWDDDVRMFGALVMQTDERILKRMRERLGPQGVTTYETAQLLASTRRWLVNGKMVHFFYTTGTSANVKRGWFPTTGLGPLEEIGKEALTAHLAAWKGKEAGAFVEEVPPEVLQRLLNSSVGSIVRQFTELSPAEAQIWELLVLLFGPNVFGTGGLPVDQLHTTRFINFTFTGNYNTAKPANAAAAAKVTGQFIGDGNRFEGEMGVLARLLTWGQFPMVGGRLMHLLAPLFEFQKEKDPNKAVGDAVHAFLTGRPSSIVETRLAELATLPELTPAAREIADLRKFAGAAVTPPPAAAPVQGGLEELRSLREQRALLSSGPQAALGVGVVAAVDPNGDPTGLAIGFALEGKVTPAVAYVVNSAAQAAGLEELGVSRTSIFVIGSPDFRTRAVAIRAANDWVVITGGVSNVVELGTRGPVDPSLQQVLKNLFGIELTPETLAVWQSFVEHVLGALAQMA